MLPKIIAYRDYKKIDNSKFGNNVNNFAFDQFDLGKFKETMFDKHAPIKQKHLRRNEASFMTNELLRG